MRLQIILSLYIFQDNKPFKLVFFKVGMEKRENYTEKEIKENKEAKLDKFEEQLEELKKTVLELKNCISLFASLNSKSLTFPAFPSKNPTEKQISTGNEGVPTDRQQTDNHYANLDLKMVVAQLKEELRRKFSSLTKQEFKVFSAIYTLEEQGKVTYSNLASMLKLTESSIRDYVMRLERKGIPIVKVRINNKIVVLHVREELRKLASLDALVKLRD